MNKKIKNLIKENEGCFAKNKFDVGRVNDTEAQVKLSIEKFVAQRPYRCSIEDKKEIDEQIKHLLDADLIEESSSPYAAPVTLVHKKEDGRKTRLCVDYRQINKLVIPETQPFPRIEDIIERTVNSNYFSVLDINSAFWSIPVKIEDREKLAFITEENHYQWKVLPFGYKNSPSIFQRTLSNIIRRNIMNHYALNYMDDIIVFSKSFEEHLEHLDKLIKSLSIAGFKLKLEKCKLAQRSVKYLGHVISRNKVRPLTDGLKAINEFPSPTNRKQVRQFLGKVNYYHKFIENCAAILEPLHNLLRKNVEFLWTKECSNAFENLKQKLCSKPILQIFDHEKHIFIETDASKIGTAAIMKQKDEVGNLLPVSYFSKKLSNSQRKRDAIYLECLAIKEAILFWQHQLIGREFTVLTDHKPLENLRVKARPDTPLGDLVIFLSQFNFKIIYRRGIENTEADALSRNPILEQFDNEEIIHTSNLLSLDEIIQDQEKNIPNLLLSPNEKVMTKIKKGKKRVILSEHLGRQLIKKVHLEFGHIGSRTILDMILPIYLFKNLHQHVKTFCESCEICLKNKSRSIRPMGFLDKIMTPENPYQMLSLDTVGGFAGYKSQKKYLHLLTDHFSKYVWILPSSTQGADDFIKLVRNVADDHEIGLLLFDRYAGINSRKFIQFLKERRIQFKNTPRNHPTSNGAVERLGQTLINRIRCKIFENHYQCPWTRIAEECVKEYNRTCHSVTKFPPCYLLDGTRVELCPIDLKSSDLITDRKNATENTLKYFVNNKQRVDKKFRDREIQIGDLVLIDSGNKLNRKKLDILREGPYMVIEQISPLMYRLDSGHHREAANVFHKSQLLPYFCRNSLPGEGRYNAFYE